MRGKRPRRASAERSPAVGPGLASSSWRLPSSARWTWRWRASGCCGSSSSAQSSSPSASAASGRRRPPGPKKSQGQSCKRGQQVAASKRRAGQAENCVGQGTCVKTEKTCHSCFKLPRQAAPRPGTPQPTGLHQPFGRERQCRRVLGGLADGCHLLCILPLCRLTRRRQVAAVCEAYGSCPAVRQLSPGGAGVAAVLEGLLCQLEGSARCTVRLSKLSRTKRGVSLFASACHNIQIRAHCMRHTPLAHGRLGIYREAGAEGGSSLHLVEIPRQQQPLAEKQLGLQKSRGNGVVGVGAAPGSEASGEVRRAAHPRGQQPPPAPAVTHCK